ncbi:hypothetical protein EUX98_g4326 [Antrodiella citrinella]|uniref:GPI mannosyltransferase 2 n=1 Tax=Antrodiella citrinella TaxID=2447956 RepID=A0A4V6S1V2_9APHY|nr:hypothetical protein EUX98_g4326 [Antrodiella citrinella]
MDATSWSAFLAAGTLACCFISSSTTLYDLTLHHTHSPTAAYLSALLSLIPTSPVTLRFVAYSEPFFTYLSYTGMLYCARSQWLWAACSFTLAGTFRSNGFMLSGFIIWGLLVEPTLNRKQVSFNHIAECLLYTTATFVPFISHQYAAYTAFCTSVDSPAPWCSHFPPFIYTYVQVKYWNVGFLKYWTPGQIPNFLMCAPILVLLLWFTTTHIQKSTIPRLLLFLTSSSATSQVKPPSSSPFLSSSIAPYAIHALLLTLIYIFASHTQIILRQAAAMPTTYWAAAYLLMENPTLGRWWVGWSVVWGAVSIVLWTTFLPPA